MNIDNLEFFDKLASLMNDDTGRYELLGDLDLDLALVMRRQNDGAFRVLLSFRGIECETVAAIDEGAETGAECWLDGSLEHWQEMFANISENGRAIGGWTLNTLTIIGDKIVLKATDPMGWDKFHRFNQTLQDFVDAAAMVLNAEASHVSS